MVFAAELTCFPLQTKHFKEVCLCQHHFLGKISRPWVEFLIKKRKENNEQASLRLEQPTLHLWRESSPSQALLLAGHI